MQISLSCLHWRAPGPQLAAVVITDTEIAGSEKQRARKQAGTGDWDTVRQPISYLRLHHNYIGHEYAEKDYKWRFNF